ncbi:MAG: sulfite exporter TauE/SafE family protein [Saprospiraceae bacterium]|nr:sulfite exporter TauE/SafE family protein [Saprospiraceae bacterium]MBK7737904.1 sulfite exporter TauE/SafE family protein [Saprospiraceae bacterium]
MEILGLVLIAFFASILTFYSGFGLGTLLLPAFSLMVPIDLAILMTALVHFLNSIFKFILTRKALHWPSLAIFGIVSLIFAILGAYCLQYFVVLEWMYSYTIVGYAASTNVLKIIIGSLLVLFTGIEYFDVIKIKSNHPIYLIIGGILSGFFGGLSGHQGALRSAFLRSLPLTKEQFIATGIACALMVDTARLLVYTKMDQHAFMNINLQLVLPAIAAAWAGAWIGNKYLKKITQEQIQKIVCICLILFGVLIGMGLI